MRYGNASFDVVTTAFSLRNFDSDERFYSEMYRILKPGGKFVILEMGRPQSDFWVSFSELYFNFIKVFGVLVDREAYEWLTHSVMKFDRNRAAKSLSRKFRDVKVIGLESDIAFIITGMKPGNR